MRRRQLACGLLTTLPFPSAGCATTPAPRPIRHPLLGQPFPDFERRTLDHDVLRTSHLRGRVVLVEFFAEWCGPCRAALTAFERLRRAHREAAFIGVAEDEHSADARWLVRHLELGFRAVHDPDRRLWNLFAVETMPTTFVADRRGTVRWVAGAGQVEAELDYALSRIS